MHVVFLIHSTSDTEGPPVAVGGTVNSNPQAWVNNCNPGAKGEPCAGDMVNELSKKVRGRAIASVD